MNAKLLTDKALREDLYIEMMYTAGTLGFYRMNPNTPMTVDLTRDMIEKQLDLLMPVIKKHIKRHVKAAAPTGEHNEENV